MRRFALVGAVGLCLLASAPRPAFAADGEAVKPAAASESAHIKPAAERKLTGAPRPTIKKKAEQKAQASRGARVSLQIPERLRKALAAKIDRRIERNIVGPVVSIAAGAFDMLDRDVLGRQFEHEGEIGPQQVDSLAVSPDMHTVTVPLRDGAGRGHRGVCNIGARILPADRAGLCRRH